MSKNYIDIEDVKPPNFKIYYYSQTQDVHLVFELVQVTPQSNFFLTLDCWSDLAEPPYGSVTFSSFKDALQCIRKILECKRLYVKDKSYISPELRSCIKNAMRLKELANE